MKVTRSEVVGYVMAALLTIWLLVSFIEVVSHNLETEYVYSPFNAFKLFVDMLKEV